MSLGQDCLSNQEPNELHSEVQELREELHEMQHFHESLGWAGTTE